MPAPGESYARQKKYISSVGSHPIVVFYVRWSVKCGEEKISVLLDLGAEVRTFSSDFLSSFCVTKIE